MLDSIYLNVGSSEAAYLAAGSVIEVIHHHILLKTFVLMQFKVDLSKKCYFLKQL